MESGGDNDKTESKSSNWKTGLVRDRGGKRVTHESETVILSLRMKNLVDKSLRGEILASSRLAWSANLQ